MKKVLFISNQLSHIKAFHLPYLKWFKEHGYEVHVMTNAHGEQFGECDLMYDLDIVRSPFSLKNISVIRKAKKIIDYEKYEMVHCHTPMGGIIGRLCSGKIRKNGAKVLYTAHGFHFYKGAPLINRTVYYAVEKFLAKNLISDIDTLSKTGIPVCIPSNLSIEICSSGKSLDKTSFASKEKGFPLAMWILQKVQEFAHPS